MKTLQLSLFVTLLLSSQAHANWQDWFRNDDQQAKQLLSQGKPNDAAHQFQDKTWRGVANYRAGHYQQAATDFKANPTTTNLYNLGNSYAFMSKLDEAIKAYETVLKQDPNHKDAKHNLEIVKQLKQQKQQQNQMQQQSQNQQDSQNQEKQNNRANKQQQPNKQQAQNDQAKDKQDQNNSDQGQDQKQDQTQSDQNQENTPPQKKQPQLSRAELEKMQANQQWLKRIQEEPQDLLKQKFLRDYLKRRKQGGFDENRQYGGGPPW